MSIDFNGFYAVKEIGNNELIVRPSFDVYIIPGHYNINPWKLTIDSAKELCRLYYIKQYGKKGVEPFMEKIDLFIDEMTKLGFTIQMSIS